MSTSVLSGLRNAVLTLTLNRPERLNAATDDLLLSLTAALERAGTDPDVRVVVITGAGRGFCAGQDLGELQGDTAPDLTGHLRRTYNPLILAIRSLPKPVLTAVNGVAAGAGASLALSGDVRLWSEAATLSMAFSSIALIPDAGSTWFLPRMVGAARAFELMAFAERVDAGAALKLGLCEQVYPAERFAAEVQAYAERLAARPPHALALTKQALNFSLNADLGAALDHEAVLQQRAGEHAEHGEGLDAFRHKRKPEFGPF
ncbi:enoyl-CoA hydratase-related protein [Deinococcus sp.]|uniref:enoyl-CoA hydratase-related protein n=1 Tax=Deinococcus sp. TaxID=47478 RepID=UPI0025D5661B|nr:enoyl-CoA hydratase-related protein [Deinococcus sp.]